MKEMNELQMFNKELKSTANRLSVKCNTSKKYMPLEDKQS